MLGAVSQFLVAMAVVLLCLYFLWRARTRAVEIRYRETLAAALGNMSNGLVMVSPDVAVTLFNSRVIDLFGIDPLDLYTDMPLKDYLAAIGKQVGWDATRVERIYRNHLKWMSQRTIIRVEHNFPDGKVISISCRPMERGGAILTYEDISEARAHEREIMRLAYHDELTGLANRRKFTDKISGVLRDSAVTLVLIDLDHFKDVNDSLGHAVGDRVLVEVAQRLKVVVGPSGSVFRIGGDEMAILSSMDLDRSTSVAKSIVEAISRPMTFDHETVSIGCSVGLARCEAGDDFTTLLKMADVALYKAKHNGRSGIQVYEPGMVEAVSDRLRVETELRNAVANGELELYYQPVFRLPDLQLLGFEALVRWNHEREGLLAPERFIPIAERSNLIVDLGAWAIEAACRQAAQWPDDLVIALNVSLLQLRSQDVLTQLVSSMDRHGILPARIAIEVTETALVDNLEDIAATLSGLRALGVRIFMDDFGSGYSSLVHLRELELDGIKIDRSFVSAPQSDHGSLAIVRAMVAMASELGISVIAEGVETDAQLERVVSVGCYMAQGYRLGRPVPAEVASKDFIEGQRLPVKAMRRSSAPTRRSNRR